MSKPKIRSFTHTAGLPPDFSGRRPRFFALCGSFPRLQMCRSWRLSNRQVDESPKRPKIKALKIQGGSAPFFRNSLAGRPGSFLRFPPLTLSPLNTLPAGKEQDKQIRPGAQGERIYSPEGVSCTLTSQAGGMGGKTGLYCI